jgi:hypothetical protein
MPNTKHLNLLWTLCLSLFSYVIAFSQTDILINPQTDGGFELGNRSFAANGWTVTANNATQVNQWITGNGATAGFTGGACAYITNQPNTTVKPHSFTPGQGSTVHFYRDVRFTAGKTFVQLTFNSVNLIFDAPLQVRIVHKDSALTKGVLLSGTYTNQSSTYQSFSTTINSAILGNCNRDTTLRLVFSWSDSTRMFGTLPPAVDNISLTASPNSPILSGLDSIFTIDNTRPTNGTNFNNFRDAVIALNTNISASCNIAKSLIFNVLAGQKFTQEIPNIIASGRSNATIIFRKSGTGVNPVIKPIASNTSLAEACVIIQGGDYITFDGIDIDGRKDSINPKQFETGFTLHRGAQYNTIKNCTITMTLQRSSSGGLASGILQSNSSDLSSVSNSYNRYLNINFKDCPRGLWFWATNNNPNPDSDIEIGSTDPQTYTSFEVAEGSEAESKAVEAYQVRNLTIHHIRSNAPIFCSSLTGQNKIHNNKIVVPSGNLCLSIYSFNTSAVFDIYNNFLSMPRTTYGYRAFEGKAGPVDIGSLQTGMDVNFFNNSVFIDATIAKNPVNQTSCINIQNAGKTRLLNNIFVNNTLENAQQPNQYCISASNVSLITSNYNVYWRKTPNTKIALYDFNTPLANLSDWRNAFGSNRQELNSIETDPLFYSQTDLHTYGSGLDARELPPSVMSPLILIMKPA